MKTLALSALARQVNKPIQLVNASVLFSKQQGKSEQFCLSPACIQAYEVELARRVIHRAQQLKGMIQRALPNSLRNYEALVAYIAQQVQAAGPTSIQKKLQIIEEYADIVRQRELTLLPQEED